MKKMFVRSMIIAAVSIFFAASGIVPAQASQKDAGPMYAITYGSGIILTSPDADIWTARYSGSNEALADVEFGKETFVAVGGRGTIVTGSRDGSTWTIRHSGVTNDLWAVKYARGIFVAVGSTGTVVTSPDGTQWTKRANLTPNALRNLSYGKDNFITIGERGDIFNSRDGISWARRNTQFTDNLHGLTYGNGIFTAVGGNGRILTSSDDGITWTDRNSGTADYLYAVTYGNEKFVATGANGTIVTSSDSRNWNTVKSGSQSELAAITHARKLFIAVGTDGSALESQDGTNWSLSRAGRIAGLAPTPVAGYEPLPAAAPAPISVTKYESTAGPTPEPLAIEKVQEPVVVVAVVSEPKVEEKAMVAATRPEIIAVLNFENVHFDFNKSTLKPEAQAILKRNAQMLKDNPEAKVRIAGYTSASGGEAYNQMLSERRAMAVQEYLIGEGIITPNRLSTIGYGESNPAMYESAPHMIRSKEAKANMRVLFEIVAR
jgi:outer membrane protein OmpA-like peptidoglycan-associated protein